MLGSVILIAAIWQFTCM